MGVGYCGWICVCVGRCECFRVYQLHLAMLSEFTDGTFDAADISEYSVEVRSVSVWGSGLAVADVECVLGHCHG